MAWTPSAAALVIVDSYFGLGLSSSLKVGGQFPASLVTYGFTTSYAGDMPRPLLGYGKERFILGLAMQAGSLSYQTLNVENKGAHVGFSLRPGYSLWIGDKWMLQAGLPIFIYSRISAAGFAQTSSGDNTIQSASLSDLSGAGGFGLSVRGFRRLGYKIAGAEVLVGAALEFLQQNMQSKADNVLSTAPTSSGVNNLSETQSGSYQLSSWNLLFAAGAAL